MNSAGRTKKGKNIIVLWKNFFPERSEIPDAQQTHSEKNYLQFALKKSLSILINEEFSILENYLPFDKLFTFSL